MKLAQLQEQHKVIFIYLLILEQTDLTFCNDSLISKQRSVGVFSELDERINWAGGRALQVGEQLGAAQRPRSRAAAALALLTLLSDFLSPGPVHNEIFNDPTKVIISIHHILKSQM